VDGPASARPLAAAKVLPAGEVGCARPVVLASGRHTCPGYDVGSLGCRGPGQSPRRRLRASGRATAGLQEFLRSSERVARKHGLTAERYQLLLLIKVMGLRGPGPTVEELATSLHLAKSTVTRELSDHDARIRHLRLSEEGERRLDAAVGDLRGERSRLVARTLAPDPTSLRLEPRSGERTFARPSLDADQSRPR
jgi:DNA-binding MarR family transcriptional regulator